MPVTELAILNELGHLSGLVFMSSPTPELANALVDRLIHRAPNHRHGHQTWRFSHGLTAAGRRVARRTRSAAAL